MFQAEDVHMSAMDLKTQVALYHCNDAITAWGARFKGHIACTSEPCLPKHWPLFYFFGWGGSRRKRQHWLPLSQTRSSRQRTVPETQMALNPLRSSKLAKSPQMWYGYRLCWDTEYIYIYIYIIYNIYKCTPQVEYVSNPCPIHGCTNVCIRPFRFGSNSNRIGSDRLGEVRGRQWLNIDSYIGNNSCTSGNIQAERHAGHCNRAAHDERGWWWEGGETWGGGEGGEGGSVGGSCTERTTAQFSLNLLHGCFRWILSERPQKHADIVNRNLFIALLIEQCECASLIFRLQAMGEDEARWRGGGEGRRGET